MRRRDKDRTIFYCAVSSAATALICLALIIALFGGPDAFREVHKYMLVRRTVLDNYIGDIDSETMSDAAYRAVVSSTEDRWSYYMTAAEYNRYKLFSQNQYSGVGITVEKLEEGGFLITAVTKDSPAQAAGITAGMVLLSADGESVKDLDMQGLRALIQAAAGGTIVLGMLEEDGAERDYEVECGIVFSDPISYEMLAGNVGYIKISNFENGCADGFTAAMTELIEIGAEAFVFDVRDNPGGKVSQLMSVLDYLLPEGELFVGRDKSGKETVNTSDEACVEAPMAVVVNANSYSAAEFFAAVLREYGWAEIVGENTTGKGRSQVTLELPDGSAVHISTNTYLTPGRVDLSEAGGITPDVMLELSEEQAALRSAGRLEPGEDEQIAAARDVLGVF